MKLHRIHKEIKNLLTDHMENIFLLTVKKKKHELGLVLISLHVKKSNGTFIDKKYNPLYN